MRQEFDMMHAINSNCRSSDFLKGSIITKNRIVVMTKEANKMDLCMLVEG